jgi:hypothetical protein
MHSKYTFKHVSLCYQPYFELCFHALNPVHQHTMSTIGTLYNFYMLIYLNFFTRDLFTIIYMKFPKAQSCCLLFLTTNHPFSLFFHHFTPAFPEGWSAPASSYYLNKTVQTLLHRFNHTSMALLYPGGSSQSTYF